MNGGLCRRRRGLHFRRPHGARRGVPLRHRRDRDEEARRYAGALIALIHVCVGTVMLAPFADLANLPTDSRAWADFVVMGAVYTCLVFALLYGAIQKLPTHSVGALSFLYPIFAMVVDFVAFDHKLKPLQFVGSAAILIAAAGMNLGWRFQEAVAD